MKIYFSNKGERLVDSPGSYGASVSRIKFLRLIAKITDLKFGCLSGIEKNSEVLILTSGKLFLTAKLSGVTTETVKVDSVTSRKDL